MSGMPAGWALVKLGDIAEVRLGRQRSPKNHVGPRMRPYLRAANVTWAGLDVTDVKTMHFSEAECETYRLLPGDILMSEASGSAGEVGKPALWTGEIEDCCFQNTLIRIRGKGRTDPEYLLYRLRLEALLGRWTLQGARGIGIYHLGASRLSNWELALPPLDEQRKIVAEVDRRLAHVDSADATLRQAGRRLIHARRATLELSIGSSALVQTVGDVIERIEAGTSYRCEGRRAAADEWGVVKVSSMSWGRFLQEENKALPVGVIPPASTEIRTGDILFSRANTAELVGASVLVGSCRSRLVLSDKSLRLVPAEGVDRRWLQFVLSSPTVRTQLSALATGTKDSMRNVSQAKLKAVRIPAQPHDLQVAIADEVERRLSLMDAAENALWRSVHRVAALRRSILAAGTAGTLLATGEIGPNRDEVPGLEVTPLPRSRKKASA